MSGIRWDACESAIHAWVMSAGSLQDRQVVWSYQGGNRPSGVFVELDVPSVRKVGDDWVIAGANPEPGPDLVLKAQGMRMATLTLQCFGVEARGGAPAVNPCRILEGIVDALPLHEEDLDVAGVGVGVVGPVLLVGGRRGSLLEPRATCEIQLHLASEIVGYAGSIEQVQVTSRISNPSGDELEVELWIPDQPEPES